MAEINIEPRKKGFNWLWLVGILLLVGIVGWLLSRNRDNDSATAMRNDAETVESTTSAEAADLWANVDLNVPRVNHPEITINNPDFELRGNDKYTVYSMGENLLFDTDKATLRSDARQNLEQIAASINQRYGQGQIRIYGHADARADAQHNKQLSEQRAEAVKNWMVSNANIDASRVSIHPMGESDPVASNKTESGQQQNRRVEIVAMNP